jgi:hypothetical protein
MKTKRKIVKLTLTRETLRNLEEARLEKAAGGVSYPVQCSYPALCPISYPKTRCATNCGTGNEC